MPLYKIKGLDPDDTYLFDEPPAEDKYELVEDAPSAPTPELPEPVIFDTPTQES